MKRKRSKTGCLAAVSVAAGLALVPGTYGIVKNHYRPVPPGTKLQQLEKRDLAARFVFDALHNTGYLLRDGYIPDCGCGECGHCFPGHEYSESSIDFTNKKDLESTDWYSVVCEFDQSRNWLGDWRHTLQSVSVVCTTTGIKEISLSETTFASLVGENITQENLEEILRKVKKATK